MSFPTYYPTSVRPVAVHLWYHLFPNYLWMTILEFFHISKNQIHGSQPTQTLPSTFGSMAWSSRQSTCFSTDKPAAGSLARMLCSSVPRATACIPAKAASFSKPSFSSSLTKRNQHLNHTQVRFKWRPAAVFWIKTGSWYFFEVFKPKMYSIEKAKKYLMGKKIMTY